jgi:hypothetical protein
MISTVQMTGAVQFRVGCQANGNWLTEGWSGWQSMAIKALQNPRIFLPLYQPESIIGYFYLSVKSRVLKRARTESLAISAEFWRAHLKSPVNSAIFSPMMKLLVWP